jgi:hypothetical protein
VTSAITNLNILAWEYSRPAANVRRFLNEAEADKQGGPVCRNNPGRFDSSAGFRFKIPETRLRQAEQEFQMPPVWDFSIGRAKEFPGGGNVESFG